jgi:hypothetical protein
VRKGENVAAENILSWNFANWVTIVLMAVIAFTLLGILQKYMQQNSGASAA